jgi:NADH:ubiquinone oxidoreductase subunit 2 (subunit N)
MPMLDLLLGLVMLILYGLWTLQHKLVWQADLHLLSQAWPLLVLTGFLIDGVDIYSHGGWGFPPAAVWLEQLSHPELAMDFLVAIMIVAVLGNLRGSLESILLLLLSFLGQLGVMHSADLLGLYVSLELQTFAFMVLCALHAASGGSEGSRGATVESAIKYGVLSALASGVLLYWLSNSYIRTGSLECFLSAVATGMYSQLEVVQLSLALLFKMGAAPLHLWVLDVYGAAKLSLLMYISTAPKLSLATFWSTTWAAGWTESTLVLYCLQSLVLGPLGAYGQPALRTLLAYSAVNEMGMMLLALESAGTGALLQHMTIYTGTQLLIWTLPSSRLLAVAALSLAGLPPLVGFFGKAWVLSHAATYGATLPLLAALLSTGVGLVYYIRLMRLFWDTPDMDLLLNYRSNSSHGKEAKGSLHSTAGSQATLELSGTRGVGITCASLCNNPDTGSMLGLSRPHLTSAVGVLLLFGSTLFVKPFVL